MSEEKCAFVTVATDDSYATGALVLGLSLRNVETKHSLVVLITSDVSNDIRSKLSRVFDRVDDVNLLESNDVENLNLMSRSELGKTFTKLHIWRLTEYSKCVFCDADTLVVKNCDELFEKEELSAVPDVGWPDCFNSGVFVFIPSAETFCSLMKMASEDGSFDGADQGLLNSYFKDWSQKNIENHLSFIYNMVVSSSYTYLPAYKHFGHNVKIVHFLGYTKPWHHQHSGPSGEFEPCEDCKDISEHLKMWWDIYNKNMCDVSQEEAVEQGTSKDEEKGSELPPSEDNRKQDWDGGRIDYLGRNSFENIRQVLEDAIRGDDSKENLAKKEDSKENLAKKEDSKENLAKKEDSKENLAKKKD